MAATCIARNCLKLSSCTASPARVFLSLCLKRSLHTISSPVLDFLLPRSNTACHYGSKISFSRTQTSRRAFTTSNIRRQASAIFNPRKDDDGNDMTIEITPRASNRLKEIMSKDSNPQLALRIQVESGGCHGFQYLMSLTTLPSSMSSSSPAVQGEEQSPALNTSSADPDAMPSSFPSPVQDREEENKGKEGKLEEDDTVFAADDGTGAKIVMDGPSLELLKGSKVDFTSELIGSQFKIVDNPLATSSCGCGTSFDIRM